MLEDDTETFDDIIANKKWDSSMIESINYCYDAILPLLSVKEEDMITMYQTNEIYDPYMGALVTLFAVNQIKGWSKEELIKILANEENIY